MNPTAVVDARADVFSETVHHGHVRPSADPRQQLAVRLGHRAAARSRCRARPHQSAHSVHVPIDRRIAAQRMRAQRLAAPASAASGRTPSTAFPSLATCNGSMPSSSPPPRTGAVTGSGHLVDARCRRGSSPPSRAARTPAPPRVGSFIATMAPGARSSAARISRSAARRRTAGRRRAPARGAAPSPPSRDRRSCRSRSARRRRASPSRARHDRSGRCRSC